MNIYLKSKPKNHLLIITLIIILAAVPQGAQCQSLTQCKKSSKCLGCDSVIQDKCTSCFNGGMTNAGARMLSFDPEQGVNNCKGNLEVQRTIPGCKYYSGRETTGGKNDVSTCFRCEEGFLNWDELTGKAECSDKKGPGCVDLEKPIPNCLNTVCFSGKAGNSYGCRMCDKKYSGYIWDENNNAGSLVCMKIIVISNCEFSLQVSTSTFFCYSCLVEFAVSSNETQCVSFTKDTTCRKLGSGNTQCEYCWDGYYWDTVKCILNGYIRGLAVTSFAVMG